MRMPIQKNAWWMSVMLPPAAMTATAHSHPAASGPRPPPATSRCIHRRNPRSATGASSRAAVSTSTHRLWCAKRHL
ncbi:MAG: hypothetical protein J3K34DRAFT_399114 [Monoraphidium minutum]|nr:MAG: hypothetical protein J3K34DRAFT_399114 [Monoraphidium minutum]